MSEFVCSAPICACSSTADECSCIATKPRRGARFCRDCRARLGEPREEPALDAVESARIELACVQDVINREAWTYATALAKRDARESERAKARLLAAARRITPIAARLRDAERKAS